jgi:outer membrane protease
MEEFSYLNRNNWGKGGLIQDSELEQWNDYSAGISFGYKFGKNLGIFAEGEFSKMWDSRLYQTSFGINYTFK